MMTRQEIDRNRRSFLKRSLATGVLTLPSVRDRFAHESHTLRIESDGGGMAAYEFTVSGSLHQEDDDDQVAGARAYGHLGPKRGTDTFHFSGELTAFELAGPATVFLNEREIIPARYPQLSTSVTAHNLPAGDHALKIESTGGEIAAYEFAIDGTLSKRASAQEDTVSGATGYGHLGPDRGVDEFAYSGTVTRFVLAGPANVFVDGRRVTSDSDPSQIRGGAGITVGRVNPGRAVHVVPGTTVLFEIEIENHPADYPETWIGIDGEDHYAEPDLFYGGLDTPTRNVTTQTFDERGTHDVRLVVYDDDTAVGSVRWTVRVTDSGNSPPVAKRINPKARVVPVSPDASHPREFTLRATDPEGELNRVIWWIDQCDAVVDTSAVSGRTATATLSYDPYGGCPLTPFIVDKNGALARFEGWIFHRADTTGNYIRIVSDGGGVATYEFTATGTVRQLDDDDTVSGRTASGRVGPRRGEDFFYFQGQLTALTVDGPATVYINGERVDPETVE